MLLEKQGTWWQTGRKAKINATRRIQTIYNVYNTRVTVFIVIRMRTCVGLHFELTTLQTLCVIELKIQILNIRLAAAAARTAHWLSRLLSPTTTTLRTKRAKVRAKVMEMRANKVITNNLCEWGRARNQRLLYYQQTCDDKSIRLVQKSMARRASRYQRANS